MLEGQGTRTVYVILEGCVEVRGRDRILASLHEGEAFGEVAFLLDTRRSANVFAASQRVRLIALNDRTLRRLIQSHSVLAAKFLLNLSKSLALKLIGQ